MSHNDSNFYKPFVFVLGALLIFTAFIMVVANVWSPDSPDDPLAVAAMKKSIQPVGQSRVDEVAMPVEEEAAAPAESDTTESDDTTEAAETSATAEAQEEENTAQVEASEDSAETAGAEATATAAGAAATAAVAGGAASLKVKATVATNCAGCHNAGLHGAAKTEDSEAWATLSEKGLDALTASVINTSAAMVSAEIPAEVKQVVDTTCSACHLVGVGNSPKIGDKDAWGQRFDAKGIDGLTASAINGIGVMPPRGGSSLDDEQMKLAVEYLMSK